jgi:hypothetical protein
MRHVRFTLIILLSICITIACNNFVYKFNQEHALKTIKAIRSAQQTYKETKGAGKYGTLKELAEAGLIDPSLSKGRHKGYLYYIRASENFYSAVAVPEKYGRTAYAGTGAVSYFVDQTGVIRWGDKEDHAATVNDPPLAKQN